MHFNCRTKTARMFSEGVGGRYLECCTNAVGIFVEDYKLESPSNVIRMLKMLSECRKNTKNVVIMHLEYTSKVVRYYASTNALRKY